jgi:hypothetical protein
MVTDYGGCPFNFLGIFLVMSSKILTVVNVNHLKVSGATSNEKIERAANVVEEIDQPFTASIFHWSFFEIMPYRQNPKLNIRLDKNDDEVRKYTYETMKVKNIPSTTKRASLVGIRNMAPG